MPVIKIRIKRNGKMDIDYDGFPNSSCDVEHDKLVQKLREAGIEMKTETEVPKEDELLQQETQYE